MSADFEDRAVSADHAGNHLGHRAIHVVVGQRTRLDQRGDVLGVGGVAAHVDQAGLDDGVAGGGDACRCRR